MNISYIDYASPSKSPTYGKKVFRQFPNWQEFDKWKSDLEAWEFSMACQGQGDPSGSIDYMQITIVEE